ncbi:MAG TPA: phosphoribosylamine--glycine ligase [Acidimicrobiia bacterium]|jgi:phosphoribosylamine--glycine ligase
MKVLLVGSGAREHALGWKLAQSDHVDELVSLPGNPGLAELGPLIEGVEPTDVGAVAALARIQSIDFVVVGPEAPLAAGLVDALAGLGIPAFGPSRAAARLESSKSFAKDVMIRSGVPTPNAWTFDHAADAETHIRSRPGPYVVKADGLAGGKGVLVTGDRDAAIAWAHKCISAGVGGREPRVVIEEHVAGPELSVFAICDGTNSLLLEPARDYKRIGDGDTGPNTGGMGSYSPVALPADLVDRVKRSVVDPVLETMRNDGTPYVGVLYAGLILTDDGPKVIEFNCRFGDPETQVVLARLESDLFEVLQAATSNGLKGIELEWSQDAVVNVVLAAHGYPESPRKGDVITGLAESPGLIFHAGTIRDGKHLRTAGGRVVSVLGRGADLASARSAAYEATGAISFKGKTYRTDIAATGTVD